MSESRRAVANAGLDCEHTAVGYVKMAGPLAYDYCTATYIGKGYAMTAAHCCELQLDQVLVLDQEYPLMVFSDPPTSCLTHPDFVANPGVPDDLGTDIALVKVIPSAIPQIDAAIGPMPIARFEALEGDTITLIGNGPRWRGDTALARRSGLQTVESGGTQSFVVATVPCEPEAVGGDSGGPTLKNEGGVEKIVGVTSTPTWRTQTATVRGWINDNCEGCVDAVDNLGPPPPGFPTVDSKSFFCAGLTGDTDGDGVPDWKDNCRTVPNADQHNCQGQADYCLHKEEGLLGDACDPFPCMNVAGMTSATEAVGSNTYMEYSKLRVHYRGVGYDAEGGRDHVTRAVDAYYCACHDEASEDPNHPRLIADEECRRHNCTQDGQAHANILRDTGWQRLIWKARAEDLLEAPFLSPETECPPADTDGNGVWNECEQPLPSRLFRRPYAGTELGKSAGDWEAYWTDLSAFRTRSFDWDWRSQDYPHPQGDTFQPPVAYARVGIWLRPQEAESAKQHNVYSQLINLSARLRFMDDAFIVPWEREVSVLPDPPPEGVLDPRSLFMLHSVSAERSPIGIEQYLWTSAPAGSATVGVVVQAYDSTTGEIVELIRSRMESGAVLNTTDFAVTRLGTFSFAVFGGRDASGALPARLWIAASPWGGDIGRTMRMTRATAELEYTWSEVPFDGGPSGRTGSVLVADEARGRLLLLFGGTAGGPSSEAWSFDLMSSEWRQEVVQVPGLGAISNPGYSYSGDKLYVYGGEGPTGPVDGLYEIDLTTLTGHRLDTPTLSPGPRSGAAIRYVPRSRAVYLFGGLNSHGRRSDLWQFDLTAGQWTLIADDGYPGAPPGMERSSLITSPLDGALTVLAGKTSAGVPTAPAWRFAGGQWQSYHQILGGGAGPTAVCRNATVALDASGVAEIEAATVDGGSYDPQGCALSRSISRSSFSCADLGAPQPVTLTVTDSRGAVASCQAIVTVVDRLPPLILSLTPSPSTIWPPSHQMVLVTIAAVAKDNCDPAPICRVSGVASNEPAVGAGSGSAAPDWLMPGGLTLELRAERSGSGTGRVYGVSVTCADKAGNEATQQTSVVVPHDQGNENK